MNTFHKVLLTIFSFAIIFFTALGGFKAGQALGTFIAEAAAGTQTAASAAYTNIPSSYIGEDGKINREYIDIVNGCTIVALENCDAEAADRLFSDVKKLDANLISTIESIFIDPADLKDKFNIGTDNDLPVGFISNGKMIWMNDSRYKDYTLIKAAFYNVDCNMESQNEPFHNSAEYKSYYEEHIADGNYPTYGNFYIYGNNPTEYFASMGQIWYMDPDWLREKDPEAFEFYETHFGEAFKDRSTDWELKFLEYNKETKPGKSNSQSGTA